MQKRQQADDSNCKLVSALKDNTHRLPARSNPVNSQSIAAKSHLLMAPTMSGKRASKLLAVTSMVADQKKSGTRFEMHKKPEAKVCLKTRRRAPNLPYSLKLQVCCNCPEFPSHAAFRDVTFSTGCSETLQVAACRTCSQCVGQSTQFA
jgi:hypothetical protein